MSKMFASVLAEEIEDYLAMREAGGAKTSAIRRHLLSLDGFCVRSGLRDKELAKGLIQQWAEEAGGSASTRGKRLSSVRGLSSYLVALGIPAHVPRLPKHTSTYVPYLFTEEELESLFASVDNLCDAQRGRPRLAADLMPVLVRLLYGTGLRLGEALSLEWGDVDEQAGVLLVRNAKNGRQRYVPMSTSLSGMLKAHRASKKGPGFGGPPVFPGPSGRAVSQNQVRKLFGLALEGAGIANTRTQKGQRGICPHCLRHQFATDSFLKMEEEGRSFLESNPYLSAYLGHANLVCTDQYLKSSHTMHRHEHAKMEDACKGVFPEVGPDEE